MLISLAASLTLELFLESSSFSLTDTADDKFTTERRWFYIMVIMMGMVARGKLWSGGWAQGAMAIAALLVGLVLPWYRIGCDR
jgi:hypothetical protein